MVLVSDHNWPEYDVINSLSHGAARLEYNARSWSAAIGTDGWIPEDRVPRLMPRFLNRYVVELVDRGVWVAFPGKGYQVSGFAGLNKPAAYWRELREARQKAGSAGGRAKAARQRSRRKSEDRGPPMT